MLAAAGLRLGILPMHVPIFYVNCRCGSAWVPSCAWFRLPPAWCCWCAVPRLVFRDTAGLVLLGFAALAGLVGGVGWLRAQDELAGRPYWILATTSLAMAAAILGQPTASLAWSLAALLPGQLDLSQLTETALRGYHRAAGCHVSYWLAIHAQPGLEPVFSNALWWQKGLLVRSLLVAWGDLFCRSCMLLTGYLIQACGGSSLPATEPQPKVDRWVWLLYIPGLITLPVVHCMLKLDDPSSPRQQSPW